jgi:hypothetical protein
MKDVGDRDIEFSGPYRGIVVRDDDPDGHHRVKASMPLQPETPWMRPLVLGGGRQRGGHITPEVGHEVAVWYMNGDPSDLVYAAVGPRSITGTNEAPTDMVAAGANAKDIQPIFEVGPIRMTVDERAGSRSFKVAAYKSGQELAALEIDVEKGILSITALAGLLLETRGTLTANGVVVEVKKRRVRTTSEPL